MRETLPLTRTRNEITGKTWLLPLLGLVLFALPLLLSVIWGPYFAEEVYGRLAAAAELPGQSAPVPYTPLYLAFLAPFGSLAAPAALAASASGWGMTAVGVLLTLRGLGRLQAGIAAALLVAVNPLVVATSGAEYAWVTASGWLALALSLRSPDSRRQALTVALLALLLGLSLDAGAIVFALTFLAVDVYDGRARWPSFFLLAGIALLGGLLLAAWLGPPALADVLLWQQQVRQFLSRSLLPLFFAPFLAAGVYDIWRGEASDMVREPQTGRHARRVLILAAIWALVSLVSRSPSAPVVVTVLALFLSGAGLIWLRERLLQSGRLTSNRADVPLLLTLAMLAPLLLLELLAVQRRYQARPVALQSLQQEAAEWLQAHSADQETIYSAPYIGYSADRPVTPAQISRMNEAHIGDVFAQLFALSPDYIISEQTTPWQMVTSSGWLKEHYQPAAQFANGYAADGPLTIWQRTHTPFDSGPREEIEAIIPDHFAVTAYRLSPRQFTPGDDIYITQYLQALEPAASGFFTTVHLTSSDGHVWAWRDALTPQSISGTWWQPGQVIEERVQLETETDLPTGAYEVRLFWRGSDRRTIWPIFRDGDENELDHLLLGYLNAAPEVDLSRAAPVGANFGDEILLHSAAIAEDDLLPGEPLPVTLFWDALQPPTADYTVFVHLLNEAGELVAAHDGMPVENRFPTQAFLPGQIISDTHVLTLPDDLPPGEYELQTGLYLLETGERLPVWNADGEEQTQRLVSLGEVQISSAP